MESSSDDEDHQQEAPRPLPPPPPPPYGDEEEANNGPPDKVLISDFLRPMVAGVYNTGNEYIKIIHENPYDLGFFEPQNIRAYCTVEGRKERERYFYLPRRAAPACLVGHRGQWFRIGSVFIEIGEETMIGQCIAFRFFLRNYPGFPTHPPTAWRLYQYRLRRRPGYAPPPNQIWNENWTLYKLSEVGDILPDSSTGSPPPPSATDTTTSDSVDGQAGASDGHNGNGDDSSRTAGSFSGSAGGSISV